MSSAPDTVEHLLREALPCTQHGFVSIRDTHALSAADEIAWLRAERVILAELLEAFSSERTPEALATVVRDRDKWWKRAIAPLDADLELVAAETAEAEARAAESCALNRLRRDSQFSGVEDVRARLAEYRVAGEATSAALRRRQSAVDSVIQHSRYRAAVHLEESSDVK